MKNPIKLCIEFFIIFILIPVSFAITYPIWIRVIIALLGFAYVFYILIRVEKFSLKIKSNIDWKLFIKRTSLVFVLIILCTTLYVYLMDANKLFCVVLNKPIQWIVILFVYSLFSVWPQEIIYRTFFFARYEALFVNRKLFVFINAIVFSLAHIFFKNTLVMVLTFIGGLLFAYTYVKTRSTTLISIEHALYGNWLFTVGMGV